MEKMIHKRFQYNNDKGGIDVQFNLEYDGHQVNILNLQVHGNYPTGLPSSPELKHHNGKLKFYNEWDEKDGDKYTRRYKYHNDNVSQDIVKEILRIRDEEAPQFVG